MEAAELLGAPYDDLPQSVGSTLSQLKELKNHLDSLQRAMGGQETDEPQPSSTSRLRPCWASSKKSSPNFLSYRELDLLRLSLVPVLVDAPENQRVLTNTLEYWWTVEKVNGGPPVQGIPNLGDVGRLR